MNCKRAFGASELLVSPIGLGCSRLGSVLGARHEKSEELIKVALDNGINFFDTSNIYAQGESERILGKVTKGVPDVVICTKVGKYLPLAKQLIVPFKPIISFLASKNKAVRGGVRQARSNGLPSDWNPAKIRKSVESSLRRLQRDHVHVLMLHSPPHEFLQRGDAIGALASLKAEGKIGVIGVSVDDPVAAQVALDDNRVEALQIPLHPSSNEYDEIIETAYSRGVAIVAREVLGGPNVIGKKILLGDAVAARMDEASTRRGVTLALLGTTNVDHLKEIII
ncbi:aldo/keto reductase [Asticcacaulis benevestitus]|uniref:NADP-dependent oxidoreductase domain-containing protein n=1 Tax=Asticcacaulis benevestitus DSM 16100 = ATCC BAA-896 TaxID=1121022 RepID=V4PZY3_9CAUL|nr:aldo/keto reductase [Asticcacaulis benevestitus]ESQ91105.1 hypothetical protein ABENE_10635 [Asticcacaulis benevestitus DSM 16100 = ATCC BAA-896]